MKQEMLDAADRVVDKIIAMPQEEFDTIIGKNIPTEVQVNESNFIKALDEVMDYFDFERVHEVMTYLDWAWGGKKVTLQDIRQTVRGNLRRLKSSLNEHLSIPGNEDCEYYFLESGGFKYKVFTNGDITIDFVVAGWHTDVGDDY